MAEQVQKKEWQLISFTSFFMKHSSDFLFSIISSYCLFIIWSGAHTVVKIVFSETKGILYCSTSIRTFTQNAIIANGTKEAFIMTLLSKQHFAKKNNIFFYLNGLYWQTFGWLERFGFSMQTFFLELSAHHHHSWRF